MFLLAYILFRLLMELCRVSSSLQSRPVNASPSMPLSMPEITRGPASPLFTRPISCKWMTCQVLQSLFLFADCCPHVLQADVRWTFPAEMQGGRWKAQRHQVHRDVFGYCLPQCGSNIHGEEVIHDDDLWNVSIISTFMFIDGSGSHPIRRLGDAKLVWGHFEVREVQPCKSFCTFTFPLWDPSLGTSLPPNGLLCHLTLFDRLQRLCLQSLKNVNRNASCAVLCL